MERARNCFCTFALIAGLTLLSGQTSAAEKTRILQSSAPDISAIHNPTSGSFNKNCIGCHSEVMPRRTADKNVKNAHAVMLPFVSGSKRASNEVCVSCHTSTDVQQQSAAQLRRNVSVSSCATCHGASGSSSKKFYAN